MVRMERTTTSRALALDVGRRRIGLAITDALGLTVQGRPTLERRDPESDLLRIRQIARDEEVRTLVVGLPLHMDGRESPVSREARAFAERLREATGLEVVLQDERLTSFAAQQELEERGMKWRERRRHVDRLAATLILEDFLRSERSAPGEGREAGTEGDGG
jgi:putative Holliday junction resolvase